MNAVEVQILFSFIFRLTSLFIISLLTIRGYRFYRRGALRTEAALFLLDLQGLNLAFIVCGVFLITLKLLGLAIPPIIHQETIAVYYFLVIFSVVSGLGFISRVFSIRPHELIFRTLYLLAGFLIGMLVISLFSEHNWIEASNPPLIIIYPIGGYLLLSSVVTMVSAWPSMRKQESSLLRTSVMFYAYGALALTSGSLIVIVLFFMGYNMYRYPIIGNIIYAAQLTETVFVS